MQDLVPGTIVQYKGSDRQWIVEKDGNQTPYFGVKTSTPVILPKMGVRELSLEAWRNKGKARQQRNEKKRQEVQRLFCNDFGQDVWDYLSENRRLRVVDLSSECILDTLFEVRHDLMKPVRYGLVIWRTTVLTLGQESVSRWQYMVRYDGYNGRFEDLRDRQHLLEEIGSLENLISAVNE